MLATILGGAVVAATGFVVMADAVEAAPLTISKGRAVATENLVQEAVVVVRRHRRRVCFWRRGRRVCHWR
ncbi:hypothetical protein RZS28_03325 [Methylocapsa polymorpha]|uniref:Secreted protein n=1 Tax=Methylocapsa polymorpha TaxID=3080828 RepID=A0ABZ0HVH5_9HYPH|nr:hypothetical protein RZS28_03325 [Methylocapsa sp. RX1]